MVIDATGDLDVAASAGAPFTDGAYIVTTVSRMGGVDTDAAERFQFEEPERFAAVDRRAKRFIGGCWQYWWLKTPLPGVVWCNCPHMTGFDGMKVADLTAAEFEGRRRMQALLEFARENVPGFERAYFVDFAPQTGVRQTRLLEGEYVVTKQDVRNRVHFHDSICRGRDYYTPYRALLPVGVDQMLVAGRHYSATRSAQKMSREIPPCMAMGEAAGIAAAQALDGGIRVRDVDVQVIQKQMRSQGADPWRPTGRQRPDHGGCLMSLGPGETTVQAGGEPGDGGCLAPSGPGQTAAQAGHEPGERGCLASSGPGQTASQPGHEPGERGCPASSDPGAVDARPLPLAGVRVLDFTQVMMGPCCTQMLGDYGADVIKIERAGSGDLSRWSVGEDPDGGNNPVFASLNRNKRSVALNLKSDADRTAALRLVETADVIVNNFRPGVMERMGFGYDDLRRINPRIIYAVGTGFGLEGPYVHKGGQDVLAQAMSGAMHRRADPELPLSIYPTTLADYSAGMHLMQGILLALLQREKTGEGQQVAVSLYNSMLAMQMQEAAVWMMRGRELNWAAMPLSGVFETTDGAIVMVGAFKENPLRDICGALGIEDLSADARYATLEQQKAHRSELQTIFRDRFAGDTTGHWLERLGGVDILCAPVKTLKDALDDPQTACNRMIVDLDPTAGGPVRLVASPIDMSAAPFAVRRAPPRLGEHNDEVLAQVRSGGHAA